MNNAYTYAHTDDTIKLFPSLARAMAYAMSHEDVVIISFSDGMLERDSHECAWVLRGNGS